MTSPAQPILQGIDDDARPRRCRYDDFHYSERLTVIYTYRCNIECSHCASEATRKDRRKIAPDDARKVVRMAAESGIRWVCWTGGEPTLYRAEILELMRYCKSLGLDSAIETNGYWAQSVEVARQWIAEMQACGLVHIAVSCDAYHLEHIPFGRIVNLAKAAKELDLDLLAFFIRSGEDERDREILDNLRALDIATETDGLAPIGFANDLPPQLFGGMDMRQVGDCGELGPLVLPDGEIIGCCNPKVSPTSPIHLGEGFDTFKESFEGFLAHPLPKLFHTRGIRYLFEQLQAEPAFVPYRDKPYRHFCEFCEDILNDPGLKEAIDALTAREDG